MRFLLPTPARRRGLARAVASAVAVVALSACSFITGVPDVNHVDLSAPVTVIAPGQSVQATGLAIGNGGNVITHARRQVSYSSNNDSVATVNGNGVITGVAPGYATITASAGGKSNKLDITVRPVPVRQVVIRQRTPIVRLAPSVTYVMDAAVIDTNNQPLGNRPPAWKSLDANIAAISTAGIVTPRALGTTRIVASVDTGIAPKSGVVTDTVTLTVTPTPVIDIKITPTNPTLYTGQKLSFTATVTDSTLATVTRRVVWTSSSTALAIDSLTGEATAVSPSGSNVTVTATVDVVPGFVNLSTRQAFASVAVLAPAASARVSPNTLALRAGAAATVTFTAVDAVGNALTGRTFRLTSSAPGVVAVPAEAVPSSYTITAGATTGTATITVQTLDASGAAQGTSTTLTVTVSP